MTCHNLAFYSLELEELLEDVIKASQTVSDMGSCQGSLSRPAEEEGYRI